MEFNAISKPKVKLMKVRGQNSIQSGRSVLKADVAPGQTDGSEKARSNPMKEVKTFISDLSFTFKLWTVHFQPTQYLRVKPRLRRLNFEKR